MIRQILKGDDFFAHLEDLELILELVDKESQGKGNKPNIFLGLLSVAGCEDKDVLDPGGSKKLKGVLN
jgi:hypothetical protein